MTDTGWPTVEIVNPGGAGGMALICEHASALIPPDLRDLGIAPEHRLSHAVWDIGARDMGCRLAARLDAPLVACGLSRLVYDCNRPSDAPDAIPAQSEVVRVPGNEGLSAADRAARCRAAHDPFHAGVAALLDSRDWQALVTLHSFTPVYRGQRRDLDIGFLHDADDRLARAVLARAEAAGRYRVALNEPYDMTDGVTYSLRKHGQARGLPNVMIEVRNDLIATLAGAQALADHLCDILVPALDDIRGGG